MKKIFVAMLICLVCVGVIFVSASATDASATETQAPAEQTGNGLLAQNPELSSLFAGVGDGQVNPDALKDALGQIEGLDVDRLLQGLDGLESDDGLLGKLASLIGPDSDGLAGILSGIGNSGAASSVGGALEDLINRFSGGGGQATEPDATVHTTAASFNQNVTNPTIYVPPVVNTQGVIDYNRYTTASYTLPAVISTAEVTTQEYLVPYETLPADISVVMPAGNREQESGGANWKKVVGVLMVFCSFAAIAAVVIKKSM